MVHLVPLPTDGDDGAALSRIVAVRCGIRSRAQLLGGERRPERKVSSIVSTTSFGQTFFHLFGTRKREERRGSYCDRQCLDGSYGSDHIVAGDQPRTLADARKLK